MVRLTTMLPAGCLLLAATPASATLYTVSISGTVLGTQSTIRCNSSSAPTCLQTYPGGITTDPLTRDINLVLGSLDLVQGDNPFTFGNARGIGYFSGTITNNNGFLTGSNLFYAFEDAGVRFATIGSRYGSGTAATFNVFGGIPEPSTWLFMLVGFGAIGASMRRRRRAAAAVA